MSSSNQFSRRVTAQQLDALWEFMNSHRDIAMGYNKSTEARFQSKMMWIAVADTLNKLDGATKDRKGWANYWLDYKGKLKRKIAANRAVQSEENDGNPGEIYKFSNIEKKYVAMFEDINETKSQEETQSQPRVIEVKVPCKPIRCRPQQFFLASRERKPHIIVATEERKSALVDVAKTKLELEQQNSETLKRIEQNQLKTIEVWQGVLATLNRIANSLDNVVHQTD